MHACAPSSNPTRAICSCRRLRSALQDAKENLREVVAMLRNTTNPRVATASLRLFALRHLLWRAAPSLEPDAAPQVEYIIRTIKKWAKDNNINL